MLINFLISARSSATLIAIRRHTSRHTPIPLKSLAILVSLTLSLPTQVAATERTHNYPPTFLFTPESLITTVGEQIELEVIVVDGGDDGTVPGVRITNLPKDASFDDTGWGSRVFSWAPQSTGEWLLHLVANDHDHPDNISRHIVKVISQPKQIAEPLVQRSIQISLPSPALTDDVLPSHGTFYSENINAPCCSNEYSLHVGRVSDEKVMQFTDGVSTHAYSKRQAWNSDESLIDVANVVVDSQTLLPVYQISLSSARVWSQKEPSVQYGIRYVGAENNSLVRHDYASGATDELLRFNNYNDCSIGNGEGSIAMNDRNLVVVCDDSSGQRWALSIDLSSRSILGKIPLPSDYNWVGISVSGRYILVERNSSQSVSRQLLRYQSDFSNPTLITENVEHGDFGVDAEGNDIYAMVGATQISYYRLEDSTKVDVPYESDYNLWGHISCRNLKTPGTCLFSSTVDGSIVEFSTFVDQRVHPFYDSSGTLTHTAEDKIYSWGSSRSRTVDYASNPRASISPSGKQIIFASNWHGVYGTYSYIKVRD